MLSRNELKRVHSLQLKKYREIHNQFLAEGTKLVLEILDSGFSISGIYATTGWIRETSLPPASASIPVTEISESEMARITALSSPGPVLAVVNIPAPSPFPVNTGDDLMLALDDIHDPGNLGTIIRIADWFGIHHIICSEYTVELYNPKVIQSTMGYFVRVNLHYTNLPGFFSSLDPSVRIFGTFVEGKPVYSAALSPAGIIVIGGESSGISAETASFVTDKISIPSYPVNRGRKDRAESLNASVATAIVCSEFRRRSV